MNLLGHLENFTTSQLFDQSFFAHAGPPEELVVTDKSPTVDEPPPSSDNRTVKLPLMMCTLSRRGASLSWKEKHPLGKLNKFVFVPLRQLSGSPSVGPHDVALRQL